ncbi:nitronate monooxygenase [Rhodoblastus acidophilus]|uniref:Propionate 3-nitronate monooxygenase n=1 Tax=Candidatus Rhodoblastus alkanivorans TaxID=2954117 RepID=A0ABS9Z4G0_9HYPH|nr:nitronate monooxygenase [Candidatus Rhodoblastus alkanivorans]MCI4680639.1 nitronate monooxygenase [Candidatus Rhodoblastus alkanivorans]MCI4682511.1 nitronate monooxygenase [Candidatus Rhodoblastus alkanivorans]MDI4639817.1 nitronate monooxygenase [Rhodoblastus acidophilus]
MRRDRACCRTFPLIQAPMAGAQDAQLAIAVCKAGGLGSLPCAMLSREQARAQMLSLRAATPAPFNVNFFAHVPPQPDPDALARWRDLLSTFYGEFDIDPAAQAPAAQRKPFDADFCALVEEIRPAVVSFHFGLPSDELLERVRRAGAKIWGCATSVAEALWLERRGVDAIIAQGREAGGHRGMFLTEDVDAQPGLFALLPQVVAAVKIPVIAAGGIADGRGVAAAFALGAAAAQIGTAYLLTPQATISAIHRAALKNARDDSTRITNLFSGRPARGLVNRLMEALGPLHAEAPAFPLASAAVAPLRAAAESRGSGDFSPLWAGEAASLAREMDAGELTELIWCEALQAARGLEPALRQAEAQAK